RVRGSSTAGWDGLAAGAGAFPAGWEVNSDGRGLGNGALSAPTPSWASALKLKVVRRRARRIRIASPTRPPRQRLRRYPGRRNSMIQLVSHVFPPS
ncbi:MAG: hypothetical protein JWQ89_277, partial [Devosia sp.]|nr:hypothetical protein [Devosia sp.]